MRKILLSLLFFSSAHGSEVTDLAYKQVYSGAEMAARFSNSALTSALAEVKSEGERHSSLAKFCFNIGGLTEVLRSVNLLNTLDERTRQAVGHLTQISHMSVAQYNSPATFCENLSFSDSLTEGRGLGLSPADLQSLVKSLKDTVQSAYDVKHAVEAVNPPTSQSNPWQQDRKDPAAL